MKKIVLWRISNYSSLDGVGGLYASGRWHSKGHPVVYCSEDPSTALLEILVHMEIGSEDRPQMFELLKIESKEAMAVERVLQASPSEHWRENMSETHGIGDDWLDSRRTPLLEVPSALVPERRNVLINPLHPDSAKLSITMRYSHPFDERFF